VREKHHPRASARGSVFRALSRKKQTEIADKYIQSAGHSDAVGRKQAIRNLSGGNQQKSILARWLASNPRLLILDEPTRGIDVGAKAEIQKLTLALVKDGMAVLFIFIRIGGGCESQQSICDPGATAAKIAGIERQSDQRTRDHGERSPGTQL